MLTPSSLCKTLNALLYLDWKSYSNSLFCALKHISCNIESACCTFSLIYSDLLLFMIYVNKNLMSKHEEVVMQTFSSPCLTWTVNKNRIVMWLVSFFFLHLNEVAAAQRTSLKDFSNLYKNSICLSQRQEKPSCQESHQQFICSSITLGTCFKFWRQNVSLREGVPTFSPQYEFVSGQDRHQVSWLGKSSQVPKHHLTPGLYRTALSPFPSRPIERALFPLFIWSALGTVEQLRGVRVGVWHQ